MLNFIEADVPAWRSQRPCSIPGYRDESGLLGIRPRHLTIKKWQNWRKYETRWCVIQVATGQSLCTGWMVLENAKRCITELLGMGINWKDNKWIDNKQDAEKVYSLVDSYSEHT